MLNDNLLKYIKALTEKDKKTLSQKVVKTMEEVGELAKEVLPLENATGTLHRLTTNGDALEEIVDSILCLLSIGYDLGMSDEQLEKMLWKKAEYWNQLQVKESGAKFPLPYEIHITVGQKDEEYFKEVCAGIGVKPLSLTLYDSKGYQVQTELMTVSKIIGNNSDAAKHMETVKALLKQKGYSILRSKIETVPWHPAAAKSDMAEGDAYFECHFNVNIPDTSHFLKLLDACSKVKAVVSMNNNKNNLSTRFLITIRDKNKKFVERMIRDSQGFLALYNPHDFMMEYAIYDTNVSQDESWINS